MAAPSKEALEYERCEKYLITIRRMQKHKNVVVNRTFCIEREEAILERMGDLWFLMSDYEQHEASRRAVEWAAKNTEVETK